MEAGICQVCQKPALQICSRCKQVHYCSRDHQKDDWAKHKLICGKASSSGSSDHLAKERVSFNQSGLSSQMIDQDNLKKNESIGTFRWNDSIKLLDIPQFKPEYRLLLKQLPQGWQGYIGERFQESANERDEIVVQPHQVDGLSFSMTLVYLIYLMRYFLKEQINIVIMGATAKAEERIFATTNYYEELTNFYPAIKFKFYFVGLELSNERNLKSHKANERLDGQFFKGSIGEFLVDLGPLSEKLPSESTIFISYNPGYGSGYDLLLNSWCTDLITLINANYPIIFTQANDYSDLRGETRVLQVIFEDKVKYIIQPQENPFRAVTHYHEEGKKESSWSCSSTHFYGIQGWKDETLKLNVKQIRENLKTKGKSLIQELLFYLNAGGAQ